MNRQEYRTSLYGFEMNGVDKRRTTGPRVNDIKQLWQRSHEIIGLALQGHNNKKIAELMGVTKETVSNTLNSKLGTEKLASMREVRDAETIKIQKKIDELTQKALKVYNEIFDSPAASLDLKKKTADTVALDLGGHRAPTQIDTRSMSVTATVEEIDDFKRRGRAAAKASGMVIDLETREVR